MKEKKATVVKTISVEKPTRIKRLCARAVAMESGRVSPRGVPPLSRLLETFYEQFSETDCGDGVPNKVRIAKRISQIQSRINHQVNQIIHNKEFQKLEASWRGLSFLINGYDKSKNIKFRVLHASKHELTGDFERSIEFDQSALFRLVYENEYGTYGGLPYTFIVGDYEFSRSRRDLFLLSRISNIASASHTPFISGASPGLLDMDAFSELGYGRDIKRIFDSNEMLKWWRLRKSEDSRYIALTLPRILLRLPYGRKKGRISPKKIWFEEDLRSENAAKYLWGNAAYALGQRICESYIKSGWLVRFFGVDGNGDGVVQHLPLPEFETIPRKKMATDVFINSSVEKELSRQGLISLCHRKMALSPGFFSARTVHKPKRYFTKKVTNNEKLSAMLPHILTSSRFAHYLKVILREKIGKFSNSAELEKYLNNWLNQYVLTQPNVAVDLKARYPLRESSVKVYEDSAKPGRFKIVSHIRPHYQLESLAASVRLISSSEPLGDTF